MTVKTLDTQNFESTVLAPGIVVVDFWASWCGPCRAFAPIYEQVAGEFEDVTFTKLNTEENREISGALGIRSIPTLMIFRDGIVVFNQAGMLPKKSLSGLVEQVKQLDMAQVRREIAAQQPAAALA